MEETALKCENEAVAYRFPIPKVYNTLFERQLIKTGMINIYEDNLQHGQSRHQFVIKTESSGPPLSKGLHVSKLNPEMSLENMKYARSEHKLAIKTEAACSSVDDDRMSQAVKAVIMLNKVQLGSNEHNLVIETGLTGASTNCGKVSNVDQMVDDPMGTFSETGMSGHLDKLCLYSNAQRNTDFGPSDHGKGHLCGKELTQSGNTTVHKSIPTGERRFVCDLCGKRFTRSNHLKSHRRVHFGERPYLCDLCGKGFTYSSGLKSHKRTHTGERPFVCDVCGKGFAESGQLKAHRRAHTGERPYVCDLCGKAFNTLTADQNVKKLSHTPSVDLNRGHRNIPFPQLYSGHSFHNNCKKGNTPVRDN